MNDSLGHHHGDELLKMVADRLRESTRETDLVARRGGDQFLLLLADLEREERGDMDAAMIRAESVVQHIHESLTSPFVVAGTELYISASMGISLFPQDGDEARRAAPQRRGRDVREQEVRAGRLRRVGARIRRLLGEAAVRHQAAQGRREAAMGAALPAGDRALDRRDDRRRGVDPVASSPTAR